MPDRPVFVAEDSPRDREYIGSVLLGRELRFYDNGAEALEAALKYDDPLLITDLQMPVMDGVVASSRLWEQRPGARIIFWTHYDDEIYLRKLSGQVPPETVYGYVLKSNSAEVLQRVTAAVFDEVQCWVDPLVRSAQVRVGEKQSALTDMEYEVLVDIALGLTDSGIGHRRYLSRRGVQSRLKTLYMKLGVDHEKFQVDGVGEVINPRARAVSVALRRGLINAHELEREEDLLAAWIDQVSELS